MGKHSASPDDWNSHSHSDIYQTAQAFNSGKVSNVSSNIVQIAGNLRTTHVAAGNKVQGILGTKWRGEAAQKAEEKLSALFKNADKVVDAITAVSDALPPVGHAMDAAKSAIQPPIDPKIADTFLQVGNNSPAAQQAAQKVRQQIAADEQHARHQMTSIFSQPAVDASNPVEDIPNPFSKDDLAKPQVEPGRGEHPGGGIDQNSHGQDGQTRPAFHEGAADHSGQGREHGQGQSGGLGSGSGSGSSGQSGGSGSTGSGGSSPAPGSDLRGSGASPYAPAYSPGSTTAAGYSPSTAPGAGVPTLRPGASSPGVSGGTGTNPAVIGAAGARGGAGAFGGMGIGGMGSAHDRSRGDDDDEHERPEFLFNYDNTDDFLGDPRPASPSVIGEFKEIEKFEKQKREKEIRRYKSMGWDVKFE